MAGGKRTRERALPKIFGPLQKSFWSALSWILVQEKQSTDTRGGWKTYRTRGDPKPVFARGVIREVFHPLFFSTPPWRPLIVLKLFGHFRDALGFEGHTKEDPLPTRRYPDQKICVCAPLSCLTEESILRCCQSCAAEVWCATTSRSSQDPPDISAMASPYQLEAYHGTNG